VTGNTLSALAEDDIMVRARRVRLVLTDSDGVLTDAGVYYSERGEELKRYSVRDGMGFELLRLAGIRAAIVTREETLSIRARAVKLRAEVYLGVQDKLAALPSILEAADAKLTEVAYIGDDVNDLGVLHALATTGITGAPADAHPSVLAAAVYRCLAKGGHGAFREFAEWILALRSN
jgi:3-deoxy-D-manno-octulosonate 8-phosphate phosphatase (KDO 8-P phosphatase)